MERAAPNITLTSVKWKSRLVLAYVRGLPRRIQGQPPRPGDYTPAHGRHPAGMFRGQARFYDSGAPLKLSRALAKIPVDRYRLPSDGRKWQHIARERMSLAEWLGVHGDGDGSHIYPAIETMRKHFGWSRRKVCYLLRDLEQLKVLVKDGYHGERGPRQRQLIPSALSEQECKIAPAGVQDRPKPECKIEEPECTVTLHTTDTRPSVSEDRRSNRQKAQGDSGDAPTDRKQLLPRASVFERSLLGKTKNPNLSQPSVSCSTSPSTKSMSVRPAGMTTTRWTASTDPSPPVPSPDGSLIELRAGRMGQEFFTIVVTGIGTPAIFAG